LALTLVIFFLVDILHAAARLADEFPELLFAERADINGHVGSNRSLGIGMLVDPAIDAINPPGRAFSPKCVAVAKYPD